MVLNRFLIGLFLSSFMSALTLAQESFVPKLPLETLESAVVKLMPFPQEVEWKEGRKKFKTIAISIDGNLPEHLRDEVNSILQEAKVMIDTGAIYKICFKSKNTIPEEGYELTVSNDSISIESSSHSGTFYALQTLRQLILEAGEGASIQKCRIEDAPQFPIRGYMIDVGRNFQSVELIKRQIDILAKYKMNTFHWHLTDRPAWRIESKIYPELLSPIHHRPSRNPGKYYTFEEIREVIRYAHAKHIGVIPEIDMPGHSDSFIRSTGVKMESEKGMAILKDLLDEFFTEIPKEMCPVIHIGSDEVHIGNPEEFISKMVSKCEENNRRVIIWNPGLPAHRNVIRQTWKPGHETDYADQEIDSWNNYINNGDPFTHIAKIFFKDIGQDSKSEILGGILCVWNDVNIEDEEDLFLLNPIYPSILTYAWKTWTHDFKHHSKEFLTKLPLKGTVEHIYFQVFESFLLDHKKRFFKDLPFQYIPQAQTEWKLIGPFTDIVNKDINSIQKQFHQSGKLKKAVGNTIYIRDRFKLGGVFEEAVPGETYFAQTNIFSEKTTEIPVWIGFETPFRANRVYGGIPEEGHWDVNDGDIWVNGKRIQPPNWVNPGWKASKSSGWGSKQDQEIPWTSEELYWLRKPTMIPLEKGWNQIIVKSVGSSEYQNWMFTFAPLEVENIIISAEATH